VALTIGVIVCAFNEAGYLGPCLHSLRQQTRRPDEILVVNNASTDRTAAIAAAVEGVRVVNEPRKSLVRARETGRVAARGQLLVYIDADCRAPRTWRARGRALPPRRAGIVRWARVRSGCTCAISGRRSSTIVPKDQQHQDVRI